MQIIGGMLLWKGYLNPSEEIMYSLFYSIRQHKVSDNDSEPLKQDGGRGGVVQVGDL